MYNLSELYKQGGENSDKVGKIKFKGMWRSMIIIMSYNMISRQADISKCQVCSGMCDNVT